MLSLSKHGPRSWLTLRRAQGDAVGLDAEELRLFARVRIGAFKITHEGGFDDFSHLH